MARKDPMDLLTAIEHWLTYREVIDDVKISTLTRDRSAIMTFHRIVTAHMPDGRLNVHTVGLDHVMSWKAARGAHRVKGRPLAATTKVAEMRSIKDFFEWTRSGPSPSPHCSGVSPAIALRQKTNKRQANEELLRLDPEQWSDLLDAADCEQTRWFMALALYSFMRAGEIRLATHADIQPKTDEHGNADPGIWINREKTAVETGKPIRDQIYMSEELQEEYARWMAFYRPELARQGIFEIDPAMALVPAYRAGGNFTLRRDFRPYVSPVRMELKVQAALRKLGFPIEKEGVHTLRRSGARAFHDDLVLRVQAGEIFKDSPIRIVMALLGHADQQTTEVYLGIHASRRARDSAMRGQRMIQKRVSQPEPEAAPVRGLYVVRNVS